MPSSPSQHFFRHWLKAPTIYPEGDEVAVLVELTGSSSRNSSMRKNPQRGRMLREVPSASSFPVRTQVNAVDARLWESRLRLFHDEASNIGS
jgi:hypothetical protein